MLLPSHTSRSPSIRCPFVRWPSKLCSHLLGFTPNTNCEQRKELELITRKHFYRFRILSPSLRIFTFSSLNSWRRMCRCIHLLRAAVIFVYSGEGAKGKVDFRLHCFIQNESEFRTWSGVVREKNVMEATPWFFVDENALLCGIWTSLGRMQHSSVETKSQSSRRNKNIRLQCKRSEDSKRYKFYERCLRSIRWRKW